MSELNFTYQIREDKLFLFPERGQIVDVPYTRQVSDDISAAACEFFKGREGEIKFRVGNLDDLCEEPYHGVWKNSRAKITSQPK